MDLVSIVTATGLFGITFAIFAETGLLIGFFLPGDSLLFTAGFLASAGVFDILPLIVLVTAAAIIGDSVGYAFGARLGPKIFTQKDSFLFHRDHLERSHRFFAAHGPKAIVLARFMPIVRTFTPVLAGVGRMHYATFLAYNVVGGLLWGTGVTLIGYKLGQIVPDVDRYLVPIVLAIILASFMPAIVHVLKSPAERARVFGMLRDIWRRCCGRARGGG